MFSNKTSCIESSQDVVETVNTLQRNKSGVEPDNNNESKPDNNDDSKRRSNKYVPNMSTIYTWDHGRPQEFFQGGANLWGGPLKICEGGPPYFFRQALNMHIGGGVVLMPAEFFSRWPQIY